MAALSDIVSGLTQVQLESTYLQKMRKILNIYWYVLALGFEKQSKSARRCSLSLAHAC